MNKESIISLIAQQGILPLFYHEDVEVCTGVIDALYRSGIRAVEFTNRGSHALTNFTILASLIQQRWQGLQLGIGTILHVADAQHFIQAGATFIVSPGVVPAVAKAIHEAGLLWVPGCLTPTEIILAKDNGAKLVKIFPGSLVGPSYITAIKEVFNDMLFMPTGGVDVNEANMSGWFIAGVCAVGLGSKVISKEALHTKNYERIEALINEALAIVKKVRSV